VDLNFDPEPAEVSTPPGVETVFAPQTGNWRSVGFLCHRWTNGGAEPFHHRQVRAILEALHYEFVFAGAAKLEPARQDLLDVTEMLRRNWSRRTILRPGDDPPGSSGIPP